VIALSEAERASLASDVPLERLHRIYNGVDADAFYPPAHLRKAPSEAEPWRIVYVGQLIELKRVHLAIQLIAELKSQGVAAHLTLVTQRDTLRSELLSYAQNLGVVGSLTWLGPRPKSEVADLMRQAHLLVVPSRTEALSTVVTEACFTALPVAAFDVGGMREQLPEGMCSLEATETERYIPMVLSILRNYDHYVALFDEHSPLAVTRFSVPRMVDEHVKLYEQLVTAGA
jgi:glycosyltransferase involved in cell wall biosynthesis